MTQQKKEGRSRRPYNIALAILALGFIFVGFNNCSALSGGFQTIGSGAVNLSSNSSSVAGKFTCNPAAAPPTSSLLRLTTRQYINALRSAVASGLASNDVINLENFLSSTTIQG